MSELKPCPFCGGPARMVDREKGPLIRGAYAGCPTCEISTPIVPTCSEAITRWNRREGIGESRREPLTEAEADEGLRVAGIQMQYMTHAITRKELWTTAGSVDVMSIVRAIEKAHGIE